MFLPCCWNVLIGWDRSGTHFDWPVRYTLYVTMSQASSGPAGHDLMDPSNPLLRDPYITCRYRRHNTPQQPQAPPMTFTFPLHEGLIRARVKLRIHLLLVFSPSESNLITEDLFYKTSWYKGKITEWKSFTVFKCCGQLTFKGEFIVSSKGFFKGSYCIFSRHLYVVLYRCFGVFWAETNKSVQPKCTNAFSCDNQISKY